MSSPSDPVETVSISTGFAPLPSRMIEPLPKARSICDSAASIAFDFSLSCMGELSTNLSADCDMATVLMARGNSDSQSACRGFMYPVCSHAQVLFSFSSRAAPAFEALWRKSAHRPRSKRLLRHRLLHCLDELLQAERLGEEVELLAFGQVLAEGVLGVARDEDHLEVGIELAQLAKERRPIHL